jgi:hypothetical protein
VLALSERLLWAFPVHGSFGWEMAYVSNRALHDGTPYVETFLGGAPNQAPVLVQRLIDLGWKLPRPLRALYAIHDGLGPEGGGIHASRSLIDLGEIMGPIMARQGLVPGGYEFDDLLEFWRDGAGNAQCFHRRYPGDDDPPTVDWDHETREISGPSSLADFAEEALCAAVADEE